MKKVILSIALSAAILVGSTYAADPGSKNDPLVTKSYVDDKIAEIKIEGTDTSALHEELKNQQQLIDLLFDQMSSLKDGDSTTYELVTIGQGFSLIGEQGTEMILRSGKGQVIGSVNGGLQDVTDGVDLQHGKQAPKYHLMVIPRTEGRGIFAETEIIVMVRGGYTIQ